MAGLERDVRKSRERNRTALRRDGNGMSGAGRDGAEAGPGGGSTNWDAGRQRGACTLLTININTALV